MIPPRFLFIIVLGAALAQPPVAAQAQFMVNEVSISITPNQPEVDDDVIVEIHGEVGEVDTIFAHYDRENNSLLTRIYIQFLFDGVMDGDFEFEHNWGRLDEGEYDAVFEFYYAPYFEPGEYRRSEDEYDTPFTVIGAGEAIVRLAEGWNLISSHIDPRERRIPVLMRGLEHVEALVMVKNHFGQFYRPAHNFNNIPRWDGRLGYLMNVNRATSLHMEGEAFEADTPIPLRQSWNMVSYFPAQEVEAPDAFRNIADNLIIAKDGHGNFYIPQQDFNNIPPLRRGQGYQIKVSEEVNLIWFVP